MDEMVSGPERGSGWQLRVLGVAALVTVALAVAVTLWGTRHTGRSAAAGTTPTPVAANATAGPVSRSASGVPNFTAVETDSFGHRVDVPESAAGEALPQAGRAHRPEDPDWLTAAPGGTDRPGGWQRVYNGPVLPFSTTDGPTGLEGDVPVGFSHTPQGAALAAEQIYWRVSARPADRALWQRLVELTPEEQADHDRRIAEGRVPAQLPEKARPLLNASDAFRIESYTDDLVVLRIARKTGEFLHGGKSWLAMRLTAVWRAGDWKVKSGVGEEQPLETIDSIEGWTRW
ncbi:hypothetical protein ACFYTQ_03810 [Nocardia sp. NPDC004068]|uniref:hypothetical protein n=1 Tax=Nocardia sp. NPDC004068 TaxID=3364303 RepID=UPI003699FC16